MVATAEAFTIARDIFAVIGAIGSVGALGWRVHTWRHEHAPHVEVKISNGFPTYGPFSERLGEWCLLSLTRGWRSKLGDQGILDATVCRQAGWNGA